MKRFAAFAFKCLFLACLSLFIASCANPASVGDAPKDDPEAATGTFTVTFAANAGTDPFTNLPAPVTGLSSGVKIAEPGQIPAREGFQFAGWYMEDLCANPWQFALNTVVKDLSLYAKWVPSSVTLCTVSFDTGASGLAITPLKFGAGSVVNLDTPYSRTIGAYGLTDPDFEEEGLYSDAKYANRVYSDYLETYTVTADVTFYAKFLPRFVVTLYGNGGTFSGGVTSVSFKDTFGEIVEDVVNDYRPAIVGSVLSGWSTDEAGTERFDTAAFLTKNLTLYAQWATINPGISGFWTAYDEYSYRFLKLDAAKGTGLYYDGFLNEISLTDRMISSGSDVIGYDLGENTLTCHFKDGDTVFSRPSVAKTPGGSIEAGRYYHNYVIADLGSDGSATGFSLDIEETFLPDGKWASDGSFLYLLDANSLVIAGFPLHNVYEGTTDGLGGTWFAEEGSEAENGYDAWSLNLKSDGTWSVPLWGSEITGTWFGCAYDDSSGFIVSRGDAGTYYCKFGYSLADGIYTLTGDNGSVISSTATAALDSPSFAVDEDLLGTWELVAGAATYAFDFRADGNHIRTGSASGQEGSETYRYAVNKGRLYMMSMNLRELLSGVNATGYEISGDYLLLYGYELNRK